jgi:hypothetical protein
MQFSSCDDVVGYHDDSTTTTHIVEVTALAVDKQHPPPSQLPLITAVCVQPTPSRILVQIRIQFPWTEYAYFLNQPDTTYLMYTLMLVITNTLSSTMGF